MSVAMKRIIKQLSYQPQWTPEQKWQILLALFPQEEALDRYRERFRQINPKMISKFTQIASEKIVEEFSNQERRYDIHTVTILDPNYPQRLKEIYDPPLTLFYQGKIKLLSKGCPLGIVGSRQHSLVAPQLMNHVLMSLVPYKYHFSIISGLALGIDGLAHQWALAKRFSTIAVVGNGLDRIYPKANQSLQEEMRRHQLILSEYPVFTHPLRHHFPQRNRIIAGLSRGVYIVEARKRSGSLITAYRAVDENRDIFVTPASILDDHFSGSNRLLQLGAVPLLTGEEILQEWNLI